MPPATINNAMNDAAIIRQIASRLRNTRLDANLTQADMAERSGLSISTINRIENGEDARFSAYIKYLRVLGMIDNINLLIPQWEMRPSQYLNNTPVRQRATGSRKSRSSASANTTTWKWGDEE